MTSLSTLRFFFSKVAALSWAEEDARHLTKFNQTEVNLGRISKLVINQASYEEVDIASSQDILGKSECPWASFRLFLSHFKNSPQMMSSAHKDIGPKTSTASPVSQYFSRFLIMICPLRSNTSKNWSRILKWNVGVRSFLLACHFAPGKKKRSFERKKKKLVLS